MLKYREKWRTEVLNKGTIFDTLINLLSKNIFEKIY